MTVRIAIGVGCRRGTSAEAIECAVNAALGDTFAWADIACVASIDAKRDEPGLRAFCEHHALPLLFFGAADIARIPGSSSPHAQKHLNVNGVCEPCALLASGGGELLLCKTITGGVTIAIARLSSTQQA
jgi:cobalt-precorrin 5A hydrolase